MEPTEKEENIHSEDWDLLLQTLSPKCSSTIVDVCERLVAVADLEPTATAVFKGSKTPKKGQCFYHEKNNITQNR